MATDDIKILIEDLRRQRESLEKKEERIKNAALLTKFEENGK